MCFSCFKTSVEKICRSSRQSGEISYWKKYKEHTGPSRFVWAPNTGENFIRTAWGHMYQKHTKKYQKWAQNIPGGTSPWPQKYFGKNQNFVPVLMLIPSGDSHNDKLSTNGWERFISPSQNKNIYALLQNPCLNKQDDNVGTILFPALEHKGLLLRQTIYLIEGWQWVPAGTSN